MLSPLQTACISQPRISKTDGGDYFCVGYVYGDTKGRFLDGTLLHISKLEKIDLRSGSIDTLNSIYRIASEAEIATYLQANRNGNGCSTHVCRCGRKDSSDV